MAATTPSTLDRVLLDARDKLVADGLFPDSAAFLSLSPDLLRFPSTDQFACVSPGRHSIDEGIRVGGGRFIFVAHGTISVTLWSRLVLDQVPHAESYLTDPTYGALLKMHDIINSLELFLPPNSPLYKGYELSTVESYERNVDGVGWGKIVCQFKVDWEILLSPQGV